MTNPILPSPAWTPENEEELEAAIVKAVPEICAGKARMILGFGRHLQPEVSVMRPITLEDVLRALDKSEIGCGLAITTTGKVIETTIDDDLNTFEEVGDDLGSIVVWKPGKPLSDQSEPTKQFLHQLLCTK